MKIKIGLFYLTFFLIFIPLAYSITVEELLSSYNFSYSDNTVNILNITHYGINKTSGLYNLLIINLSLNTSKEGNYTFTADLFKDRNYTSSASKNKYLGKGQNTINLEFNPKLLSNGMYILSLGIDRNEQNIYNNHSIYSFNFNNTDYEKPEFSITSISHEFIDNDSDLKYDILSLNIAIDSKIEKNAEISVYLVGNDKVLIEKSNVSLVKGFKSLNLDINTNEIKNNRMGSLVLYKISVNDYSFDENYIINEHSLSELSSYQSQLLGIINETAIDLDQNGLIDYLQLNLSVDVKEDGIYTLQTSIYNIYDEFIGNIQFDSYLSLGNNTIPLIINGTRIYSKKINGPYTLVYLKLSKDGYGVDYLSNPYITQYYSFDQFEKPSLPDLEIEIEVNNETANIITLNKGDAIAFNFFIEVYENTTLIDSRFVVMLQPNETYNINLNKRNDSTLIAIADFNNNIEENGEENNFYFYSDSIDEDRDGFNSDVDCNDTNFNINPAALELCDGIDNNCDLKIDEGFDKDSDEISDFFDNCPLISNENQEDDDKDNIGNVCDYCPNTNFGEEVDNYGCSNIQFCKKQAQCGLGCDLADWENNEPFTTYPYDCMTVIISREGRLEPICAGLDCAD